MTDGQIIKAFLACNNSLCESCSYHDIERCEEKLQNDVIDIIMRQRSEIEEKNNEIIEFQKQIIGLLCRGISEIIKVKGDDTECQLKNS